LEDEFVVHDWDFTNNNGPVRSVFDFDQLKKSLTGSKKPIFKGLTFTECDFSGIFDLEGRTIVFEGCAFTGCDFGLSTWSRAKFSKCTFTNVSMTQTRWTLCEFRECKWQNIGISGNSTEFNSVIITNPREFISSAYTNLDKNTLAKFNKTKIHQRMRLEWTKATTARELVYINSKIGEELAYYESVRAMLNQSSIASIWECIFNIRQKMAFRHFKIALRLFFCLIDLILINIAGLVNAWGRSTARPAVIGFILVFLFSIYYYIESIAGGYYKALIKSAEITLLIGFTNHSPANMELQSHFVVLFNMIVGLAWYVIFIPTVINRICRIR
jgi:hypothetical protein